MGKNIWEYNKQYSILINLIQSRLRKDQEVLVVGTGTSIIKDHIVSEVQTLTTCDGALEQLCEFRGGSYDVVIINHVIHTVKAPKKVLQEAYRVLKNDGILMAPTFIFSSKSFLDYQIKTICFKLMGGTQYQTFSGLYYKSFIENQKFHIIQSGTITGLIPMKYIAAKKLPDNNWTRHKNTRRPRTWNQKMHGINMRKKH